jgi:peptide/nickel transport system permease protein
VSILPEAAPLEEAVSDPVGRRVSWLRFLRRPDAIFGITVVVFFVVIAILAPYISPYGERERVGEPFEPPSSAHWLGTDGGGRDMLTLMLWGARVSLVVGFAAAAVAILIGGTIGILGGYLGGKTDTALSRLTDYFLVIPDIPLIIVVAAIWGRSLTNIIIIIGVIYWTTTSRLVRAQVLTLRERVYVKRARAVGAGHTRIVARHILPQVSPLLISLTVLTMSIAIFAETAIAFLGLGDPSLISWGKLIENAFQDGAVSVRAWNAILPPGIAVALVILACTMIGRSLEDTLNPRLRVGHLSIRRFRLRDVPQEPRP